MDVRGATSIVTGKDRIKQYHAIGRCGLDATEHGVVELALICNPTSITRCNSAIYTLRTSVSGSVAVGRWTNRAVRMPHLEVNSCQRLTGVDIEHLHFIGQGNARFVLNYVFADEFSGNVFRSTVSLISAHLGEILTVWALRGLWRKYTGRIARKQDICGSFRRIVLGRMM